MFTIDFVETTDAIDIILGEGLKSAARVVGAHHRWVARLCGLAACTLRIRGEQVVVGKPCEVAKLVGGNAAQVDFAAIGAPGVVLLVKEHGAGALHTRGRPRECQSEGA